MNDFIGLGILIIFLIICLLVAKKDFKESNDLDVIQKGFVMKAIVETVDMLSNIPNMNNEQQGSALGMASILITEIAITEKEPVFDSKGRLGNAATRVVECSNSF